MKRFIVLSPMRKFTILSLFGILAGLVVVGATTGADMVADIVEGLQWKFSQTEATHNAADAEAESLLALNQQIIDEAIVVQKSSNANRERAKDNLRKTVNKRKNHIINTMKNNPKEFLKNAITPELKEALFQDIDGIEQKITLRGKIEIICEAGEHDHEGAFYAHEDVFIVTADGTYYAVYFANEKLQHDLLPGDTVKAVGYELDNNFVPDTLSDNSNFLILAQAEPLPPVTATLNRMAVILVNFDVNTTQPFTKSQVQTSMAQAKEWYEEVSLGNITYAGKNDPVVDVYGYYTVPYNNCNYTSWMTEGQKAAARDGFALAGYKHVILLFPRPVSTCEAGVAGRGSLGGTSIWLFGTNSLRTTTHEMGHNWGLHHARSATCVNTAGVRVPVSDDCTYSEYGDPYDVMGGAATSHFHAFSKNSLGWIPNTNKLTVSRNGVYEVYPIAQRTASTQVLHIPITYKNSNGINTTWNYYVEFRGLASVTNSKYDNFTSTSAAAKGVMIRQASSRGAYTNLFNANAATTTSFSSAPLEVGKTFSDPIRNVHISVVSVDNAKATVEIKFGDPLPVCVKADPTVRITPSTLAAAPREAVTYRVDITNNNSKDCAPEAFTMRLSDVPAGFTTDKTTDTVTLASAGSSTLTYVVTSPSNSYNGIYAFSFIGNSGKTYSAQYIITKGEDRPVCVRIASTVEVTPSTTTIKPWVAVDYKVTVKNNDSVHCAASSFTVSATTPNGSWTLGSAVTKSLAPGESFEATIRIASKSNEKNGTYTIPFSVKNGSTAAVTTKNATYVIEANATGGGTVTPTCTRANPAISLTPTSQVGAAGKLLQYTLSVKNNDTTACADNAYAVTATMPNDFTLTPTSQNITLKPGETRTLSFSATPNATVTNGNYSLAVSIKEGTSTYNASATYTVSNTTVTPSTPPTISTSGITDGGKLGNGNNKFQVTASHANGIAVIEIYLNGVKVETCNTPKNGVCEHAIHANNTAAGTYVLKIDVTANDSARTQNSKTVTFTR